MSETEPTETQEKESKTKTQSSSDAPNVITHSENTARLYSSPVQPTKLHLQVKVSLEQLSQLL